MTPDRSSQERRFLSLYDETRQDLLVFLLRRATTPEDAADLLAETYLIAWRRLEAIPDGQDSRLWLFGVARNLLLKAARQHRVRDAVAERLAGELAAAASPQAISEDRVLARFALSSSDCRVETKRYSRSRPGKNCHLERSPPLWASPPTLCECDFIARGGDSPSNSPDSASP